MSGSDSEAAGAPRLARPEWECLPDGRVDCLINSDTDPVVLSRNFSDPIEIRLGGWDVEPVYLIKASKYPQLEAAYVVMQPRLSGEEPSHRWALVGGKYPDLLDLGTEKSPQFSFGPQVERFHLQLTAWDTAPIDIADASRSGTILTFSERDRLPINQLGISASAR